MTSSLKSITTIQRNSFWLQKEEESLSTLRRPVSTNHRQTAGTEASASNFATPPNSLPVGLPLVCEFHLSRFQTCAWRILHRVRRAHAADQPCVLDTNRQLPQGRMIIKAPTSKDALFPQIRILKMQWTDGNSMT